MSEPEPCPYDGAHEPGKPILCWSPGGPCELPNAPGCETCGPCNHCDPDKSPKWADLFGIDPTFDQPEQAGVDREGLAEVVMAASPGTPTLTALKIADALADLLAARDRRVRAEVAVCEQEHGHDGNPARVYGHFGSRRTCIRLKATDEWVYDPAWEATDA